MRIRTLGRSVILAVLAFSLTGQSVMACSAFRMPQLGSNSHQLVGRNFDWDYGHGLILVNKRGVAKRAIQMQPTDTVQWVSKYGSLTFNQAGRELPYGGVNEAGLMIEVLWLGYTAWPVTTAPSINEVQWIQHQLDTKGSVKELVAKINDVRILSAFAKVHFIACDATGDCASIEGAGGQLVAVHEGAQMPLKALTNDTYEGSIKYANKFIDSGTCSQLKPGSMRSLDRFARAACAISVTPQILPGTPEESITQTETARANAILDDVAQGSYTQWRIVYDLTSRSISIRTKEAPVAKTISLRSFDLSCAQPAQALDLQTVVTQPRDVSGEFGDASVEQNLRIVEASLLNGFAKLPQATVDQVVAFPDTTVCVAP